MKKIVVILLIVCAGYYFWQRQHQQAQGPDVIANPVYAEMRIKMAFPGREVEGVMLGKTADQADCQKHTQELERVTTTACPTCKVQTSECKTELASRYTKFFDNVPSTVTYLSLARGDRAEREFRVIYWGVTLAESDKLCEIAPAFQKGRKGAVTCIRAARE
jgi:hypothetical protein